MKPLGKVYLAARYGRRLELVQRAEDLRINGIEVTSRWLSGTHSTLDEMSNEVMSDMRQAWAMEDWEDVMNSDTLISFTEQANWATPGRARGGRHVEFGAALATGKRCIVIGPRENIFYYMPGVEQYNDFGDFLAQELK